MNHPQGHRSDSNSFNSSSSNNNNNNNNSYNDYSGNKNSSNNGYSNNSSGQFAHESGGHDIRKQPQGRTRALVKRLRKELNRCADQGDIIATEEALGKLIAAGDHPTTVTMNILIKAYGRGCQPMRAVEVLQAMYFGVPGGHGAPVSEGTFNAAIAATAENGQLDSAWQLLQWQLNSGFSAQNSFCTILRHTPSNQVLPVLQSSTATFGICINSKVLCTALVALLEVPAVPDLHQAECVIQLARSVGTPLDSKACTILLTAYNKLDRPREGITFFNRFVADCSLPDLKLLTTVINMYVSHEPPLMSEAQSMLSQMKSQYKLKPDTVVLNSMIRGFGKEKPPNVEQALEIFNTIMDPHSQVKPSAYTFSAVANVLCSAGQAGKAEEIVRGMEESGIPPSAIHYNILLKGYSRCRCKVVTGYCKCRICTCSDPNRSMELLHEMEARGLRCDVVTVQSLIEAFCSAAQTEKALSIINKVLRKPENSKDLRPTTSMYNMILRGVCIKYFVPTSGDNPVSCGGRRLTPDMIDANKREDVFAEVDAILREMELAGLRADDVTFNTTIGIYCSFGCFERGLELMHSSFPRYRQKPNALIGYNILLNGLASPLRPTSTEPTALDERVTSLLDEMVANRVQPDTVTLNTIIKVFVDHGFMELAEASLTRLLSLQSHLQEELKAAHPLRIVPNSTTFSTLIHGYLHRGLKDDAKRVLLLGEDTYNVKLLPSARSLVLD